MAKFILKESEIRQYVRSLIREAIENEGNASQKTINKWLNMSPEDIEKFQPNGRQDPLEIAQLKNMLLGKPYNREMFGQSSKDIEDAFRMKQGLPSLRTKGGRGKRVKDVDSAGTDITAGQTPEEKAALKRQRMDAHNEKEKARSKAKTLDRQAAREKEALENPWTYETSERDYKDWCRDNGMNPKDRASLDAFNTQRQQDKAQEVSDWCVQNGIDPNDPNARAMFDKHAEEVSLQRFKEMGLESDKINSPEQADRRIAFLKKRLQEIPNDDLHEKLRNSIKYVLKDAERIKRTFSNGIDTDDIDMNIETGEDELDAMFDNNEVFEEWCNQYHLDPNDANARSTYKKMLQNGLMNTPSKKPKSSGNDTPSYNIDDDDFGRGRGPKLWDDPSEYEKNDDDDDDDDFML